MLSMLMVGARTSIAVALVAVGIGIGLRRAAGPAAAAAGQLARRVIMRGNDLVFAFPSLVIAILITAVFGPSATVNAILAIGIFNIPVFARVTRGGRCRSGRSTTSWRRGWRARGADLGRAYPAQHRQPADRAGHDPVLAGHPGRGRAQLCRPRRAAAGSLLGPDAGRGADDDLLRTHAGALPGLAIVLMVLGLNLLGDGLRDALDPRLAAHANNHTMRDFRTKIAPMIDIDLIAIHGTPILRDVSLDIAPGEVFGLVGESGSGKSMTALALMGLLPDGGDRKRHDPARRNEDLLAQTEAAWCATCAATTSR
jgi:peptide/nickel transport system permease protein